MNTKFQTLDFEKFSSNIIKDTSKVFGGRGCDVPDGGAECDTGPTNAHGNAYSSDTDVYNGAGTRVGTDYHLSNS